MEQNKPKGETDLCRNRLLKYCQGQGLDLGCGAVKIKPDAIGVDLHHPDADMHKDARKLDYYDDGMFDFVYSSHLLEEIQDTEPTLKEWIRVLKDGGHLVLYQADADLYFPLGDPRCNTSHKHHFKAESLAETLRGLGMTVVLAGTHPETKEWSFELVARKGGNAGEETAAEGISILVPTLNRPKGMEELAVSVDATAKDPSTVELLFGVHADDLESAAMAAELQGRLKIKVKALAISRHPDGKTHLSYLWNQLYARAAHPIVGFFGDDVIFRSPGWDEEVRREFLKDINVMVSCNDVHVQRGKQATLFFTHKSVHEKIGYYLHPGFRRWFMDTLLGHAYTAAGKMRYREDIVTEHFHPDCFPERLDDTYRKMDGLKEDDRKLWESPAIRQELARCISLLKE